MQDQPETDTPEKAGTPATKSPRARRRAEPDPRVFFVVWSPEGGDPVVRYPTFDVARHAAWRLSEKYPGQGFFVLRSCWGRPARVAQAAPPEVEAPADGGPDGPA